MTNKKTKGTRNIVLSAFCVAVFSILCGIFISSYSAQELVSSVTIDSNLLSYEEKESGSFSITKSARWISNTQVKVTLDIDTISFAEGNGKDFIFLLDVSDNMKNGKLLGVKKEVQNIINTVLLDSKNRIALVTYSDTSKIVSYLTNDKEALTRVLENIEIETEGRNCYQALKNLESILKESRIDNDRDTSVILITGGYSNKETTNEVGEYEYLKEEYPSIPIYGIEYEVDGRLEPLRKVSDQVYSSTRETLKNHLYQLLGFTKGYEALQITDYTNSDQFSISGINDITVSDGTITTEGNQVIWNLEGLPSGKSSKAEYIVTVKNETEGNIYSVSERSRVDYKIGDIEETFESTKTPILGRDFDITYEGNSPKGCVVENLPEKETHQVFNYVTISENVPICKGYEFEGWKNVTEGVNILNDEEFLMPESNITFRATWSKVTMKFSLDGEVHHYLEGTIRKVNHIDTEDLWKYKDSIKKIIFEDRIGTIENAIEVYDISSEKNGSIMAYIVSNGDESYTAYIQGDGKVKANQDSSYLFDRFTSLETIEGIEYLDTSKVTSMSHMFGRCSSLISIDLSYMDTSNVKDMSYMFHDCRSLRNVDLSELDLSKVENMEGMFKGCTYIEEVIFPSDGITNVDNLKDMFKDCPNLAKIKPEDLSIKDTADTDGIFDGGNNLEEPPIKKEYKVTITGGDGGIVFPESHKIAFGKTETITVTPNAGYYLESFSCTNGYKNNAVIDIFSSESQVVTISNNNENKESTCTATFEMVTYTIDYNLDGGTISGENPLSFRIDSEPITLLNPSKKGHTFTGWIGSNGETAETSVVIPTGSFGNRNYTANWKVNTYTVNYTIYTNGFTINSSSCNVSTCYDSRTIDYNGSRLMVGSSGPLIVYMSSYSCTNGYTVSIRNRSDGSIQYFFLYAYNNGAESGATCTVYLSHY